MITPSFTRFAAGAAIASAFIALAYSITFGYYVQQGDRWAQYSSSGLLMAGGLVGLPVLIALYQRLRLRDEGFALLALVLGLASAFGSVLHGAHDVAVFANESDAGGIPTVPSFTDPRGFATFALFGLSLAVLSLALRGAGYPKMIAGVGAVTAALVIVVYIGRVTILNPKEWWNASAAILAGVIGLPLWNAMVARTLWREAAAAQPKAPPARNAAMVLVS